MKRKEATFQEFKEFTRAVVRGGRAVDPNEPNQVPQAAIVENKQPGAALAFIREAQLGREPERRNGPRRRDQHDLRLFKVG